ncbi:MAG TPA: hypothetical protein VKT77_06185 [Chthonomonadaceae bacterium]|nr:hypothetical protein [Chthonomonadaceae bacterium]
MSEEEQPAIAVSVHPGFGSIYREGEFVQQGSVLGLATDERRVVIAPVSGWIRVPRGLRSPQGIWIEIRPRPRRTAESDPS